MSRSLDTLFLLSSERSGSNLLTRMFDAHQDVCGPAPTHIGSDLLGNLHRYPSLGGADRDDFLTDFMGLFETKLGAWKTAPDRQQLARGLAEAGPLQCYLSLYRNEAMAAGKGVVFIKENRLYRWAPLLMPVLPATRFVYLCRDPRDMALSWQKAAALRGGILRAARVWAEDQQNFLALRAQLEHVTQHAVPLLRYEDLLDHPVKALGAVCEQLELPFDSAMLDFHAQATNQAQAQQVQEWKNIGAPLMEGNHGKFPGQLSHEAIAVIEGVCRDAMASLAYQPTQAPLDDRELAQASLRLEADEPWSKPAFRDLPEAERQRRQRQHQVFERIRHRSFRAHNH